MASTDTTHKLSASIAVGVTFDTSDTRKFSLDVTALTKVSCELVAVPPPRQLMALADKMAGTVQTTVTTTDTTKPGVSTQTATKTA